MQHYFLIAAFLFLGISARGQSGENFLLPIQSKNSVQKPGQFPFLSENEAIKGMEKASNYELLNGIWKFRWVENGSKIPPRFYEVYHEDFEWDNIQVPANWELKNYGSPYEPSARQSTPVGLYRRSIVLPKGWEKKAVFIHFEDVSTSISLWCNGRFVGSEASAGHPTEFALTEFLSSGKNQLTAMVAGDTATKNKWQLSGIEGDVWLYFKEKTGMFDFEADVIWNPTLPQKWALSIQQKQSQGAEQQAYPATIFLKDTSGKTVYQTEWGKEKGQNAQVFYHPMHFVNLPRNIRPWTPENPDFYTLQVQYKSTDGNTIQVIEKPFAFRTVNWRNDSLFVNHQPIRLHAVHFYPNDPDHGHVISQNVLRKEIFNLKAMNFNTIYVDERPSDLLSELCLQSGLLVAYPGMVDDQSISFHGSHPLKTRYASAQPFLRRFENGEAAWWKGPYENNTETFVMDADRNPTQHAKQAENELSNIAISARHDSVFTTININNRLNFNPIKGYSLTLTWLAAGKKVGETTSAIPMVQPGGIVQIKKKLPRKWAAGTTPLENITLKVVNEKGEKVPVFEMP